MESVVSSNVARIGYDADSRVLTVEFRNGSRYEYENVPATEYAGFLGAWSKGRYLHRWIKGRYDYRKL
ncbi:MAG: KTSC domain-containing protein [Myxococcales bacterium]|nr:KTSC domain-containing protein [Myxococcales bacterium]